MTRAALVIVLVVAACRASRAGPSELNQLAGKPLYLALCRPCHGNDARGYTADHAPSLVSSTFLATASDEFLRQSIVAGRPGTSMAAYGRMFGGPLDDVAVGRLVGYLRGLGPAVQPLDAVAAGDAATGAAVYAKQCLECHGDARSRSEGVWLGNVQFQQSASDAFIRYAIVHGRPGTKMAAFDKLLSPAEIDGVVSYVRSFGANAAVQAQLPPPTGVEPLVVNPNGRAPAFSLRADPCPPAGPGTPAPPCTPDPRFASVEQVARALAAKQRLIIIDARPPSEWMRVHITGAVSIPYHDLKRLDEIAKDGTWIIAYCACPHHLSGIVVDELRKRGYAHAAVLDEGITEWHRRGLPVVAAPGVPRPAADLPAKLPPGTIR